MGEDGIELGSGAEDEVFAALADFEAKGMGRHDLGMGERKARERDLGMLSTKKVLGDRR